MYLINGRILTPEGVMDWLAVRDGRIAAYGNGKAPANWQDGEAIDAARLTVMPGFIDLHIHGSAGYDVMDATPEALFGMARFLASHGVTAFLPTTLTHPQSDLLRALENIRACMTPPSTGCKNPRRTAGGPLAQR